MDTSILQDIGLTNAEIKIYLDLLKSGTSKAGPIIEKTGLQNSVVHTTLHKMCAKGFVTYVKRGKVRYYQAADPKTIVAFIEKKKKKLESILPQLLASQHQQEKQEVEIFEGFKGFKVMLYEFTEEAKKDDEYLYFAFHTKDPEDYQEIYDFYQEFEKERNRFGITLKGLAPSSIKHMYKKRDLKKVKFIDFPIPTNISVFKNKIIMTPWEDKKISFLITSRQLAESFRQYFYSIWNQYKK